MRSLTLLLAAAAALALPAPAPAPAASDGTRACLRAGRTILAGPQVRVFSLDGLTYACWTPRRRVRRLATGDAPRGPVLVAGRYVARRSIECGAQDERCDTTVHVLDVRTGRERFRSPLPGGVRLRALVLTQRGWPAWIEDGAENRVVSLASGGVRRVLDAGDVAGGSLALAGTRLYWVRDGEPRVAKLPPP